MRGRCGDKGKGGAWEVLGDTASMSDDEVGRLLVRRKVG